MSKLLQREREISPGKKFWGPVSVEIIEPEAEVVDNICLGNARTINPPRPAILSARDLCPERENQLDSAEAYR